MARQLILYHGLTINKGNHNHVWTKSHTTFLTTYAGYVTETLSLDNYRINNNVASCKLTEYLTEANYNTITYIADVDTQTNYYRYYHVKSAICRSGFVSFVLEIDLWQTNIVNASITSLDVYRSTRKMTNGFYDEIIRSKNLVIEEAIDYWEKEHGEYVMRAQNISIAFLMQYNISQAVFGNNKITATEMFVTANIKGIYDDLKSHVSNAQKHLSALDLALGAIGTITEVAGGTDAQVIKAWIVDNNYVDTEVSGWYTAVKCIYGGYQTQLVAYHLTPQMRETTHTIDDFTPNKTYYVGSYLNGFKLTNYCNSNGKLSYQITWIVDDNELKVIASQGERVKDITNDFEVYLTINASIETSLRRFARNWATAVSASKAGIADWIKGGGGLTGIGNAVFGFSGTLAGMVDPKPSFENAIGGGDGYKTFKLPVLLDNNENLFAEYVKTPYVVQTYLSDGDEAENALKYGLNYYRTMLDNITDLWAYDPLQVDFIDFLQCKAVVTNAQEDATNFIEAELLRGIHILNLDNENE